MKGNNRSTLDEKDRRVYVAEIPGVIMPKKEKLDLIRDEVEDKMLIEEFKRQNKPLIHLTVIDKLMEMGPQGTAIDVDDEIDEQEQNMLFETASTTYTELYPKKTIEQTVSEEDTQRPMIEFISPLDMSSDEEGSSSSSDTNSSNNSGESSQVYENDSSNSEHGVQHDNRNKKEEESNLRSLWTKHNTEDKVEDDENKEEGIKSIVNTMEDNITTLYINDMSKEKGNIETAEQVERMLEENRLKTDKRLRLIDNVKVKERISKSVKIYNPSDIDYNRNEMITAFEKTLNKDLQDDNIVINSIAAYKSMLQHKRRIKRFKFNLERKIAVDLQKSKQLTIVIKQLKNMKKHQTLVNKILIHIATNNLNVTKERENKDIDDISLLKVKIVYDHGMQLLIDQERYSSALDLTQTEFNIITTSERIDPEIKKLITDKKVIIFDIANMMQSMKLSIHQIEELSMVMNDYGLTTIAVIDSEDLVLSNATINVVEDKYGHDDVTVLLYAIAYNAVVITNDTHKEFREIFHVCTEHDVLHTRQNEECNVNDGSRCRIKRISPNKPMYMSIKSIKGGQTNVEVVFDLPLIRHRNVAKKGKTTIKFFKNKSDIVKRWNIPTTSKTPVMVHTIRSKTKNANCNILTFNYMNTTEIIINNNKLKSMAYLLNTMSEETITTIKRKIKSSLQYVNGKITLVDISNRQLQLEDQMPIDRVRTKVETMVMMKLFGTSNIAYKASSSIKTLFDVPLSMKYANNISIVITATSLSRKIAALVMNSEYALVLIDDAVISKIESSSIEMMRTEKNDDTRDILPITIKGMTQYISYSKALWGEEMIKEMVNINIGKPEYKALDLKGFKSGDIYWDLRYDKSMADIVNYFSEADIINSIDERDDTLIYIEKENKANFYIAHRSGTIYDAFKSAKTNRTMTISYRSNSNTPAITLVRIGRNDADKIYNAINKTIDERVRLILEDITSTYRTMITDYCLVCLPPLIWAYTTNGLKHTSNSETKLVEFIYKYRTVAVRCYVSVGNTCSIIALKVEADYKVLFPAIAMRYSNSYEHKHFDFDYMDYIHSNGLQLLYDDPQAMSDYEKYETYYNIFALPMIFAGFAPSSKLTAFKPVIVDNVVVDYVDSYSSPWAEFVDEVIVEPHNWLAYTDLGFIYPMRRKIKDGTDLIDINGELHNVIDELLMEPAEQELKFPMFLKIFSLLYPWDIMVQHLKQCYGYNVDAYMTQHEVAMEMILAGIKTCTCVIDVQEQVDTLGNITNYPQGDNKKVITQSSVVLVQHTHASTQIVTLNRFQNDKLINSVPLIGKVVILDIFKFKEQWKTNRMTFTKRIMANQKTMNISVKKVVIKQTKGSMTSQLSTVINDLVRSNNNIIVILGFDELGSLIKKEKNNLTVRNANNVRIYVPDLLLYAALRNYMMFERDEGVDDKTNKTLVPLTQSSHNVVDIVHKAKPSTDKTETLRRKVFGKDITDENMMVVLITVIACLYYIYSIPAIFGAQMLWLTATAHLHLIVATIVAALTITVLTLGVGLMCLAVANVSGIFV